MKSITIASVKGGWIVSEPNYGSPVEKEAEVFTCLVALRTALPRLLDVPNPVEARTTCEHAEDNEPIQGPVAPIPPPEERF